MHVLILGGGSCTFQPCFRGGSCVFYQPHFQMLRPTPPIRFDQSLSWMYVVKILRTCVSHIFFSGVLSRAAKVLIPNPLLSLSKQMNSWSFVDKSQFLPEAAFSISGESLQFQKLMEFKGETLSRKLCSTSNWADVRQTKFFIRVESSSHECCCVKLWLNSYEISLK